MTVLNTTPSSINDYHFTFHNPESKYFIERQLTIPVEYIKNTGVDPKRFRPCYIHRSDAETKKLFQNYDPLIRNNKLLIRPLRAVYVGFPEIKQGTVYYVDPNTPNNHWYINKIQQNENIIIDNGYLSYSNVNDLFHITLPYFKDIDLITLTRILDEENELLRNFRNSITEVIKEASNNPRRIEEIKNDIASSSIERLNRKFHSIKNKHRFVIGASLSNFILTLSFGHLDIESLLKSLATSLTVMGVSEYDYRSKMTELKEDPYYLLWRISKP